MNYGFLDFFVLFFQVVQNWYRVIVSSSNWVVSRGIRIHNRCRIFFTWGKLCFLLFLNFRQRLINFEEKKIHQIRKCPFKLAQSFLGPKQLSFKPRSNYGALCGFKSFIREGFFLGLGILFSHIISIFLPQNATNEQRIFRQCSIDKATRPLVLGV